MSSVHIESDFKNSYSVTLRVFLLLSGKKKLLKLSDNTYQIKILTAFITKQFLLR